MFNVTVTINGDSITIDLAEESLTDEDSLIDLAKERLGFEPEYDEEGDETDPEIAIKGPSECHLMEAFEYVEWLNNNYDRRDAEDILAAAVELDIPPGDIDEAYHGEYPSVRQFIENILEDLGEEIPDWVSVDYEQTWESFLRFDYVEENGHYFRQI